MEVSLILIVKLSIREMMNENGTRKGERTKKPPKYMQYDDADYGVFLPPKVADQKQKAINTAQINQIARILHRFLININQKSRDHHQPYFIERSNNDNENGFDLDSKKESFNPNPENTTQKPSGLSNVGAKRGRDASDRPGGQPKIGNKKAGAISRSHPVINGNIQADLDYHSMINEHIRNAYPNISNFSPQMLKGLDIPRQLLEYQTKGKNKDDLGKGNQILKNIKMRKQAKEDLKPFKRQSYHVAIAYHIHLKRIKSSNPTSNEIDPTYPARKMRQSQAQSQKQ